MHPSEFLVHIGNIKNVQLTPQATKSLLIKWFCEDIRHLFVGTNMLKVNITFSHMITYEVVTNINMLSLRMLHGIACNLNSTLIITK